MVTKQELIAIAICLTVLVSCGSQRSNTAQTPTPESPPIPTDEPEMVALRAAQGYLEHYLGRPLPDLQVAYAPREWPDASMGCPEPGAVYHQAVTAGYQFDVVVDGVVFELHTTGDGSQVVLCPSGETGEPPGIPLETARSSALSLLAAALDLDPVALPHPVTTERARWTNSALDCPGASAQPGAFEGYRFQVAFQDLLFDLRASGDGQTVLMCSLTGPLSGDQVGRDASVADLPSPVQAPATAASAALASELGLGAANLTIDAVHWRQTTFPSAALGCPTLGLDYAQVLTPGFALRLTHGGSQYEVHTDLAGSTAALCQELIGAAPVLASSSPVEEPLDQFRNDQLGVAIGFPSDWWVATEAEAGSATFRPGNGLLTLGTEIDRVAFQPADFEDQLDTYLAELSAADPAATPVEALQTVNIGGLCQRYQRTLGGMPIVERVTLFPEGYQVRQWAPAGEWSTWDQVFLRMLAGLEFLPGG